MKDRLAIIDAEAETLARDRILNDPSDGAIILAIEEITGLTLTPSEASEAIRVYNRWDTP